MTSLAHLRTRGGRVIVINPVREQGLVNFSIPSQVRSLLFGSAIASTYVQPMIGGDLALLHGIAKAVMEYHPEAIARDFIAAHSENFACYRALIEHLQWDDIILRSGVAREVIDDLAAQYATAKNAVFAWTMGLTHHVHGVANLQSLINLALLRGMVGRPHAGLLPIRGHSNVQGLGSMAVTPTLKEQVFRRLQEMGFSLPTRPGLDTMASMHAASRGEIDFALCLGGNLYGSNPDMAYAREAFSRIGLVVYLSTTLNTGHAHGTGQETIILPVAARDEEQQATTQESMFNFVRLSDGGPRRLATVRSEVDIISALGYAVLGNEGALDWQGMAEHPNIRRLIAQVIPGYEAVAELDRSKQEFFIPGRILHVPNFATPSGRAQFATHELPPAWELAPNQLVMMSVRSEGQFNTVVYEEEDRYRGQERRDVILLNPEDMRRLGIVRNQPLTVSSPTGNMHNLLARPFNIHVGCALMYYPEANALISTAIDPESRTPAFKATVVTIDF
jgi:molybdopterin-dependent oxidoreductase alpha subunit